MAKHPKGSLVAGMIICSVAMVSWSTFVNLQLPFIFTASGRGAPIRSKCRGQTVGSVVARRASERGPDEPDQSTSNTPNTCGLVAAAVACTCVALGSSSAAHAASGTPLVTQFARQAARSSEQPRIPQFFAPLAEGFTRSEENRNQGMLFNNDRMLPMRQRFDRMNADPTLVLQVGIPVMGAALASKLADQPGKQ